MTILRPRLLFTVLLLVLALASRSAAEPPSTPPQEYDGRTVAQWQAALSDKDPHVRRRAAYALGQFGPAAAEAVAALVVELDDRHLEGAWYAADTLGRIGPPAAAAVAPLVRAMEDPQNDPVMRHTTACALGRIGESARAAIPALTKALTSKDAEFRVAAAAAVWRIEGRKSALFVIAEELESLSGDGSFAAARTLAELGPAAAPVVGQLVSALDNPNDDLQRATIDALGRIGLSAIDRLAMFLDARRVTDPSRRGIGKTPRFYCAVAAALGEIADAQRRERLDRAGLSVDDFRAAARRLDSQLVPALVLGLSDPHDEVRAAAARALARVGIAVIPSLLVPLAGSDLRAAEAARQSLAELEHYLPPPDQKLPGAESVKKQSLPTLLQLLGQTAPAVRAAGFRLFAAVGVGPWGKEAVPALRTGLADPNPEIRRNAATALARIENPEVPSLQSANPHE